MELVNAFIGKTKKPTNADISEALARAKTLWDQLLDALADQLGLVDQQWNSYSPKFGWSLRLKRKKRNILYLCPCPGSFYVAFVLGDKAMKTVRQCKLPKRIVKIIDEAKRYPEGTGFRIDIRKSKDLDVIKMLAEIKLDN